MKFNILLSAAVIAFCSSAAQATIDEVSDSALSTVSGQLGKGQLGKGIKGIGSKIGGAAGGAVKGRSAQDNPYHIRSKLGSILIKPVDYNMPKPGIWIKLPHFDPSVNFALDVSGNDMSLAIGLPK